MTALERFPASQKAAALGLALIVAAVFVRSVDFELLQWDDHRMLVANPHVASINAENLRWMFTDTTYNRLYMPLGWLAYAVSVAAVGFDAHGQHAINVALHIANTLLVFALLQQLLRLTGVSREDDQGPARIRIAFIFALLWALHPLRVEVVAWVAARVHAQAALFTLASLLCYLRAARQSDKPLWRSRWFCAAVFLYAVGLLSFPAGLMLPAVLIVLDIYLLQRKRIARLTLEKLPMFLIAAIPVVMSLYGRETGTIYKPAAAVAEFSLLDRALQALFVWSHLALVQLWPVHLAPVYTRLIHFDAQSPVLLAGAAFTILVTAITFSFRRTFPLVWAAWLCHLLLLVPFLGLTEHPHIANDRYTYLDAVIWSALLAVAANRLVAQRQLIFNRVAITATACLAILSFQQLAVWRDSITLFSHTAATMHDDPYRAQMLWRIAGVDIEKRDYASAIRAADDAIAADRNCAQAWGMKVLAQRRSGDAAGAQQTLADAPKLPRASSTDAHE